MDQALSKQETMEIVTPYAFGVSESLFGTPLASPAKRAIALLIDMFLVSLLTYVSGAFLSLLVAVVFYRQGMALKGKPRRNLSQKLLRFIAAVVIFFSALALLDPITSWFNAESDNDAVVTGMEDVTSAEWDKAFAIGMMTSGLSSLGQCNDDVACLKDSLKDVTEHVHDAGLNQQTLKEIIDETLAGSVSAQEAQTIKSELLNHWQSLGPQASAPIEEANADKPADADSPATSTDEVPPQTNNTPPLAQTSIAAVPDMSSIDELVEQSTNTTEAADKQRKERPVYSIVEYVKALIEDLGIGFGWAALYFSVFCAWTKGKTPGKKIMGIRVIQLDGSYMNLWEAFNRYGGYGAGIATGLLGFLQIFWDPNRQAIQDKISETLVIDDRKPKRKITTAVQTSSTGQLTEQVLRVE